jgi:protein TonB
MKTIAFIFLISLWTYQNTIAQYDNPPEPILIEEVENETTVFYVSDPLPYLSSCENDSSDYNSKKETSNEKLLHYVYTTLNYPDSAKVNEIEGMVVLTFLIEKDGWIDSTSIRVLRDIGHGCGEEALRIVRSFNEILGQWSFYGKPVEVRYNLPIRFKLN